MTDRKLQEAEAKIANQRAEIIQLQEKLDAALWGKKKAPRPAPSPACDALRRAGYFVLPRWWVTQDQMDVIERMAKGNRDEVYRIKKET